MDLHLAHEDFEVKQLGKCTIDSPIRLSSIIGDDEYNYIKDGHRVLYDVCLDNYKKHHEEGTLPVSFRRAGPEEKIYFEPAKTRAAIVTCGGLCPGLNNVIRALVFQLYNRYNVNRILGIQYGYEGFVPHFNHPFVELTPELVDEIHTHGGSILGSSRGNQDVGTIVDTLERHNINILFAIGGDGTLRGAHAIQEEIEKRNLKISIAGIPKTIDNDINLIERSFGFETSFSIAKDILRDAHNEAKGAYNGIAMIKLMGRDSGFIAANAVLACPDVNFVLIPEQQFDLEGSNGFLAVLKKRLEEKHHAVIVVAEGAGQHYFEGQKIKSDASGNVIHNDIGLFLKDKITEAFKKEGFNFNLRYIDPSYILRSAPANANDSKFCIQLAQNAVHAAMAGRTDFVIGNWNNYFTILPIPLAIKQRNKINLESELWYNVLESTGQPIRMHN